MDFTHGRISILWVLLGALAAVGIACEARGQSKVDFKIDRREAWVGQPFILNVEVVNAEDHVPPVVPEIEGAEARLLDETKESSFTQIKDGRVTRQVTVVYTIVITPLETGVIEIPPIRVVADGTPYSSRPWRIIASRSEVGNLLFVDILADPEEAWVGEAVDLTLQIWVKQYRDSELGVALDGNQMWELIDEAASSWGIFADALQQSIRERRRPRGREVDRDEIPYFLFEIPLTRYPIKTGDVEIGDVRIVYSHPTGLAKKRDFFGRPSIELVGARPVMVEAERAPVAVRPLPEAGRPEGFTGAVGRFRVRASATPTEISVGDPITLTIEVRDVGDGSTIDLANLRPPDLGADPALEGFRIPDTPTTGVADGRAKTFTETLRPERDDLTEIPGIAFSSFDPILDRYVVERTEPIPIRVSPSERLDLGSSVIGTETALGPAGTRLITTDGTLRANRPVEVAVLGHAPLPIGWPVASLVAIPPIGFAAAFLIRKRIRHRERNPHLVRASLARRNALATLEGDEPVADRVHRSLVGLVAAKLHRPEAAMTSREMLEAVETAGLDRKCREELKTVLETAENARYAAGPSIGSTEDDLVDRARSLLVPLDRIRPPASSTSRTGGRS